MKNPIYLVAIWLLAATVAECRFLKRRNCPTFKCKDPCADCNEQGDSCVTETSTFTPFGHKKCPGCPVLVSCETSGVCTADAKVCSDGSEVGRDPDNNCEFFPCPGENSCSADVKECDNGSFVGRDPENGCKFLPCGCTEDAKTCDDGSSVGRDPYNNCKFFPCPEEKSCTEDAKLCDDGSSVGRDPRNNCKFFPCPKT
jgi:hypothetical protein